MEVAAVLAGVIVFVLLLVCVAFVLKRMQDLGRENRALARTVRGMGRVDKCIVETAKKHAARYERESTVSSRMHAAHRIQAARDSKAIRSELARLQKQQDTLASAMRAAQLRGEKRSEQLEARAMHLSSEMAALRTRLAAIDLGALQSSIQMAKFDPGPMIEKKYRNDPADRYGIGQWPYGQTRVYAAGRYDRSRVNLSFANPDGSFSDVVQVDRQGLNVTPADGKVCIAGRCMTKDTIQATRVTVFNNQRGPVNGVGNSWSRTMVPGVRVSRSSPVTFFLSASAWMMPCPVQARSLGPVTARLTVTSSSGRSFVAVELSQNYNSSCSHFTTSGMVVWQPPEDMEIKTWTVEMVGDQASPGAPQPRVDQNDFVTLTMAA